MSKQNCDCCGKPISECECSNLICPFCGEDDFDKIGLKSHLEHGDCEPYNNTEKLNRIF